jgi:DNA replication protein DnaC
MKDAQIEGATYYIRGQLSYDAASRAIGSKKAFAKATDLLQRKDRLAKSLVTRAKFRSQVDIEDWDQSYDRGISKQKLRELSQLGFFHSKENLIILGRTGQGNPSCDIFR